MKKELATPIVPAILALPLLLLCSGAYAASVNVPGLSDAEESYHEQIFDYTMNTVNPDQSYDWASYSGKGTITVGKPFVSKSRANCREFSESYTVQNTPGTIKGYGCQRSDAEGTWCRLKQNAEVLSCSLENPRFMLGTGSMSVPMPQAPDMAIGSIGSPNVNINVTGPNVNVETPNVHAPHINMGGGQQNRQEQQQKTSKADGNRGGEHSDVAYGVTDAMGTGAAKGTGWVVRTFQEWFR